MALFETLLLISMSRNLEETRLIRYDENKVAHSNHNVRARVLLGSRPGSTTNGAGSVCATCCRRRTTCSSMHCTRCVLGSNTLFFSAASPASNTALPIRPSDGGVCTSSNTGKVTPCCASGSRGPVRESSLYGRLRCGYIRNSSARLDLDNDTSWPTEICGEEPRREGRARPTGVRGIRADANQPEYAAPSTQSQSIVSLAACMWANCHGPCWAL